MVDQEPTNKWVSVSCPHLTHDPHLSDNSQPNPPPEGTVNPRPMNSRPDFFGGGVAVETHTFLRQARYLEDHPSYSKYL